MSNQEPEQPFEGDLFFNGVDGTGKSKYALPPLSSAQLGRLIQGKAEPAEIEALLGQAEPLSEPTEEEKRLDEEEANERDFKKKQQDVLGGFPVKPGVEPGKLEQAGWAVVFPAQMDPRRRQDIQAALKPLLDWRKEQTGDALFRIFAGQNGVQPGERKDQFCKRQDPEIKGGAADPEQMPFYVLLVGSPDEISYEFQFQLDVMRAVGRIDFGDDLDAYSRYAQSVVDAERGKIKLPRQASLFGVNHDLATYWSSKWLVKPLFDNLKQPTIRGEITLRDPWQVEAFVDDQASKGQLKRLLGGDGQQAPALLFTASHGMKFDLGDARQRDHQGALLCQWGGEGSVITPDDYMAGQDVVSDARVQGMMAMFFACYGAGTPQLDAFAHWTGQRMPIAPHGFVAALPGRLLGLGALAVIGHVERAWGYSFISPGGKQDNQAFVTTLRSLMNGDPIGLATDASFDMRYSSMSSDLAHALQELAFDPAYMNDSDLSYHWMATNDARNYVILGDPAARLPVADVQEPERPDLLTVSFKTPTQPEVSSTGGQAESEVTPPVQETVPLAGPPAYVLSGTVTLQPAGGAGAPGAFAVPVGEVPSYEFDLFRRKKKAAEDQEDTEGQETRQSLLQAVKEMAENATRAAAKAVQDAATLEVLTYTSDDMGRVQRDNINGTAKLRAITRVLIDGDIEVCVPQDKDGQIDQALWAVHSDMVQQAQANRTALIKAIVDAVSFLAKVT